MAIAIAVSITSAFAFSVAKKTGCENAPQYRQAHIWYIPAGTYGYNYICVGSAGFCTYYKPDPIGQPNYYAPCRYGAYTMVQ